MAELQTQISFQDVAKKYGVSAETLTRLAQDGIIRTTKPSGEEEEKAVSVSTVAAVASIIEKEIKPEMYEHLRGQRIRLMEAARKHKVSEQNLFHWAERGYIQVLDRDVQKMELSASDVAYASDVFKRARELTSSSVRAGWVLKRAFA
ncbi:MAG: hypothetical protein JXA89_02725 [Anaerolineae bacterium]|nr:hypothetical protein [Anaerolineae bacterium]